MKKGAYLIVVIGLCLVINSLLHSIYDLWHKQDLLVNAQKELVREQEKNQKLKANLKLAQTQQFVEEQAHDKLFMVKNGEESVLISGQSQDKESKNKKNLPNWQQWIDIFF